MGWITPVRRPYHPCIKPARSYKDLGRLWRCEVCDELWEVDLDYSAAASWRRCGWYMRALYRGHGYGEEPAVPQEPELSAKVRVLVPFAAGLTFLILLVTLAFVTRS